MNLNLLSYLLFFPAMLAIAVWTAQVSHRHGRVWMLRIFDGEAEICRHIAGFFELRFPNRAVFNKPIQPVMH